MKPLAPNSGLVEPYLRRLRRALRPLPDRDRAAIVAEIEAHIAERTRKPQIGVAEVLAGLGDPVALAGAYLEADRPTRAPSPVAPGALLTSIARRTARGLVHFTAGLAILLFSTCGLSFAVVAGLKPIAPRSVGLWISPDVFAFGALASPGPAATEVLGLWIVPVSLTAAGVSCLAAFTLMKRSGRWLPRRSQAIPLA